MRQSACFLNSFSELVCTRSIFESALDSGAFFYDLIYCESVHQFWNGFQVSITAAVKSYVRYNVVLDFQIDLLGTCSLCVVRILHCFVSFP